MENHFEREPSPVVRIERVNRDDKKLGGILYRIKYGGELFFVGSDGSVEGASDISQSKKEEVFRNFQRYANSQEGREDIAQAKEKGPAD